MYVGGGNFKNEKSSNIVISNQFLKENPYLVLDTAFFSEEFKEKIIADIENLDDNINGVLIHGDNFQALNLMQEKYKEQVQCVYIDPPYNTENKDFNYKDNYKHSSWLSMMNDRLDKTKPLMSDTDIFFSSIDDNEVSNLNKICNEVFGENGFVAEFIWEKKKKPSFLNVNLGLKTEYILAYSKNRNMLGPLSVDVTEKGKKYPINNAGNSLNNLVFPPKSVKFSIEDCIIEPQDMSEGNIVTKLLTKLIIKNGYNENEFTLLGEWRYSQSKLNEIISQGDIITISKIPFRPNHIREGGEIKKIHNLLTISTYNVGTNEDATSVQESLFGKSFFDYAKPVGLLKFFIKAITYLNADFIILDFFAGSGTTGHAVIDLNREDNGNRKYILVEMGEYFDTVTKPRIEKVIYSKDWKDGKPISREGSSHIFKYIRLESYEDTLNNVEFSKGFNIDDYLQNEYLTKYKIQKEAENSKIYLPAEVFYNPFEFHLKITRKNESMVQKIDLIETFNFLIGLQVNNIYTKKYNAEFKTMELGRLQADIKPDNNGKYIFKIVEGSNLKGEKVLVIWRNIIGDIRNNDEINKNNAVLESVTLKNQIKPADSEYDIIYINCTNSLQNFAKEGGYKVALIEEIMKDKMFNGI